MLLVIRLRRAEAARKAVVVRVALEARRRDGVGNEDYYRRGLIASNLTLDLVAGPIEILFWKKENHGRRELDARGGEQQCVGAQHLC